MAATLGDWIGLILISALAYAIYTGVRSGGKARQMLEEQKSALQAKGVSISSEGVAIKSNRAALDRDAYINATKKKLDESGAYLSEHAKSMKFGAPGNAPSNAPSAGQ